MRLAAVSCVHSDANSMPLQKESFIIFIYSVCCKLEQGKCECLIEVTSSRAFQYYYNSQASCKTTNFAVNLPRHSRICTVIQNDYVTLFVM